MRTPENTLEEPLADVVAAEQTLAEIMARLTWDNTAADGVTTIEERLRAGGHDPNTYDQLYD